LFNTVLLSHLEKGELDGLLAAVEGLDFNHAGVVLGAVDVRDEDILKLLKQRKARLGHW
jgi:hypothetical protein